MEYLADRFCSFMIENGADSEKKAVYIYALVCVMNEFLIDSFLLVTALCMSAFSEMFVWIIVFNSVRMNIGGYHAETRRDCFFFSIIIGIGSIIIGKKLYLGRWEIIGVTVVAALLIWNMAPVIHPNYPLPDKYYKNARKRAFFGVVFWGGCAVVFEGKWPSEIACGMTAIIVSSLLMLIGKHKKDNRKKWFRGKTVKYEKAQTKL